MFIDRRWPVVWWIVYIMRDSPETVSKLFLLVIAVDQVIHVVILAVIAAVSQ